MIMNANVGNRSKEINYCEWDFKTNRLVKVDPVSGIPFDIVKKEIYLELAEKWVDYDPDNYMLPRHNNTIRIKEYKQFELFTNEQ